MMNRIRSLLQLLSLDAEAFTSIDPKMRLNDFDALLTKLARAAAADGLDRRVLMKMFVTHAFEVVNDTPGTADLARNRVLQEAVRLKVNSRRKERRDHRGSRSEREGGRLRHAVTLFFGVTLGFWLEDSDHCSG